ncbi:NrfD/PsrC family molybdoenzyme membrane anchor subunit [Moorellaceae bacterium AZ2]
MQRRQNVWGSLAVGYFFLASVGAMCLVTGVLLGLWVMPEDVALPGWLGLCGLVLAGTGGLLLLAELGKKFRFPMVFLRPRSIMCLGAWALGAFLFFSFCYTFFSLVFPGWGVLRTVAGVAGCAAALVLVVYPGLELGEARGRPFWQPAGLVPLWVISSTVGGLAVTGLVSAALGGAYAALLPGLKVCGLFFSLLQLIFAAGYVLGMLRSGTREAREAAEMVVRGSLKLWFWVGLVMLGHVVPWALLVTSAVNWAWLLFLVGVLAVRHIVVAAGLPLVLPGNRHEYPEEEELASWAAKLEEAWLQQTRTLNL